MKLLSILRFVQNRVNNFEFRKKRGKKSLRKKIENNILEKNDVSNVTFSHLNNTINADIISFTKVIKLSILRFFLLHFKQQ